MQSGQCRDCGSYLPNGAGNWRGLCNVCEQTRVLKESLSAIPLSSTGSTASTSGKDTATESLFTFAVLCALGAAMMFSWEKLSALQVFMCCGGVYCWLLGRRME